MSIGAGKLNRRQFVAVGTGAAVAARYGNIVAQGSPTPGTFQEAPALAEMVAAGTLPAVAERLPLEPLVVEPLNEIGTYGGTLRGAHTNPTVFEGWMVASAEGLLSLGRDFTTLNPNLATAWEISDDGLNLTIHLRAGVKWSDGQPFTTDDILFWWEDVVLNDELTPVKPIFWAPGGSPMTVKKVDEVTIQFTFAVPYFKIVENLASGPGVTPVTYPKHFLQEFHVKYADKATLDAAVSSAGVESWGQLFLQKSTTFGLHPIGMTVAPAGYPTLGPMMVESNDQANVVAVRNPYYWKVDPAGNQLPYIDGLSYPLVQDPEALKLKILAGEIDFEGLQTILKDYPLFRDNEGTGGYRTLLWNANFSGNVCLMFNQTTPDEAKRSLFQDVRFRQAMSLGIDRDELNQVLYLGQAKMQQATANEGTSYYDEAQATSYATFDTDQANALLDEIGMSELDGDGFRKRSDGESLTINFEYWNGHAMGPAAELVADQWRTNVKVRVTPKSIERSLWEQRMLSSEHELTCWLTDKMSEIYYPTYPNWLVPLSTVESGFGTKWAQWYVTKGAEGEEPPDAVKSQFTLYEEMQTLPREEAIARGKQIGQSQADNLWAIGTAATGPMPIIANVKLANIPEEMPFYGNDWMFTVITHPETWYFAV